jgi:alcohol dehydrogenase (NADP+)
MRDTQALRADAPGGSLELVTIQRRDLRPDDVAVRVTHCGVCHTDLHGLRSTDPAAFPVVPGHEFVGEVTAVGDDVTGFAVGDPVAVGNIVDSCGSCAMCVAGQENFCAEFPTLTYGGRDRVDGTRTWGGYAGAYVVREHFVYHRPTGLDPAAVAPLLCAGITVWEPLRTWEVGAGSQVGVVGLGGLGHLAVKFAVALGADVTVFTASPAKRDAARTLGAGTVVLSTDHDAMRARARTLDLILDTAAGAHDPSPYLDTLRVGGTMAVLGVAERLDLSSFSLRWGRHNLTASGTGSPSSTAEMLAFAAARGITADIELLPARDHAIALERLAHNDVRWRFVLDMHALPEPRQSITASEQGPTRPPA